MFRFSPTSSSPKKYMLKKAVRRLAPYSPGSKATGGLPFHGNFYQGRVNADDYKPPPQGRNNNPWAKVCVKANGIYTGYSKEEYPDDIPEIRMQLDQCPYFALCDMVVWQGMDAQYLDPGLLTNQEHYLLLFFSRMYYEKWNEIHNHPRELGPFLRKKRWTKDRTLRLLQLVHASPEVLSKVREHDVFDDSYLSALNPSLWLTANMDPVLRNQLTGVSLLECGLTEQQLEAICTITDRMRTVVVVRTDMMTQAVDPQYRFVDVPTLFDLYQALRLPVYSGQIKTDDFVDRSGAKLTQTISTEDDYFDFCTQSYMKARIEGFGKGSLLPHTLKVVPQTTVETSIGKWI